MNRLTLGERNKVAALTNTLVIDTYTEFNTPDGRGFGPAYREEFQTQIQQYGPEFINGDLAYDPPGAASTFDEIGAYRQFEFTLLHVRKWHEYLNEEHGEWHNVKRKIHILKLYGIAGDCINAMNRIRVPRAPGQIFPIARMK